MNIPPKINIDLHQIQQRKEHLEIVGQELKQAFIGIDYIIDELINYIQIWYLMPEILSRPVIVNLWGMTGVGKTDLVRKLVSKLNFQDRFAEVELSHTETWSASVSRVLDTNRLQDGQPSIILFDEIQRFCTVDVEGKPILNTRYQDFWELLSDGRLAKRDAKEEIEDYLQRFLFSKRQKQRRAAQDLVEEDSTQQPVQVPEDDTVGLWQAQNIKKLFSLEKDVMEIAEMKIEELLVLMQQLRDKKKIYEPINHSQSLIIISGNLDEAYSMASETAEADIDADIFRAYTEKITIVDIKNALSRRFKPEQVARFGNIHLIYRSLRKTDFEALIQQEIDRIIAKNRTHFGIDVRVSPNVNRLIYQNGVFPVQGVRPVFSSILDILESHLSRFLFEALMTKKSQIEIDYDFDNQQLVGKIGHEFTLTINYIGKVDSIRQSNLTDTIANVSVHEAGHAVVYGLAFGLAPLQLKSKVASSYAAGFTFSHLVHQTKENMLHKINIYLAGGLAEDLIFGEQNATTGRSSDREEATHLAVEFVRKYGFTPEYQASYENAGPWAMSTKDSDAAVEALLQKQVAETKVLLEANKLYLLALSKKLRIKGDLTSKEVTEIALPFGINLRIEPENFKHVANYGALLDGQ